MQNKKQRWGSVSQEVKDLLRQMLHIVPQKRPTASQLLLHPWFRLSTAVGDHPSQAKSQLDVGAAHCSNHHREATAALRGAVNATFRAIASPHAANVGPVGQSELAKRRAKDKPNTHHP